MRSQRRDQGWGVAHNTDEAGTAFFFAPTDSVATVRISPHDLKAGHNPELQEALTWQCDLAGATEKRPLFDVSVSAEALKLFHEAKRVEH